MEEDMELEVNEETKPVETENTDREEEEEDVSPEEYEKRSKQFAVDLKYYNNING